MTYKIKEVVTYEEYKRLLDHIKKSNKKHKKQYEIALILGFEAGLRISEIVGLHAYIHKDCDSEVEETTIKENDKSYKRFKCLKCGSIFEPTQLSRSKEIWQIEPLTKRQLDFERNYILLKQAKGQKDRIVPMPVSLKRIHEQYLPITLKRRTIEKYIKKIGKELLNKDITPHTLRAGFATHLLDKGIPIHQVQLLMGHSRIDTTGVYARASPKNAVENARKVF